MNRLALAGVGMAGAAGLYGLERLHLEGKPKIEGALNETVPPPASNRNAARMTWGVAAGFAGYTLTTMAPFASYSNHLKITGPAAAVTGLGIGLLGLSAFNLTMDKHSPELISEDGIVPEKTADTMPGAVPNPDKGSIIIGAVLGALLAGGVGVALGVAGARPGFQGIDDVMSATMSMGAVGAIAGGFIGNGLAGPSGLRPPSDDLQPTTSR